MREPLVFLLDEPSSNLDAKLRVQTRTEIARLHQATRTTFVYVTHDQVEAMTMGDRIAVMNAGVIQQLGAPQQLYDAPANLFVAGFIGSPAMNFFSAQVTSEGGSASLVFPATDGAAARTFPLGAALGQQLAGQAGERGSRGDRGHPPRASAPCRRRCAGHAPAVADVVEHLGNEQLVYVKAPGAFLPESAAKAQELAPQEASGGATVAPGPSVVVRIDADARVSPGDRLALAIDTDHFHLFDPVTTNRFN